ncbi:hypothetical protein HHI36_016723 [Cryptolaemus montrouzieri]|uniref:Uncharacterized protein n=1 Tax=Cryptolaemus montrouzieri TaxID=559131 RepID=A0ABD2NKL9_9CUCU
MNGVQLRIALGVTSTYRTVSGPAAMVVAKLLPLNLLAMKRQKRCYDEISASELRQEKISAWQRRWDEEERACGPEGSFRTQVRGMEGQLERETPDCLNYGKVDTVEHTIYNCVTVRLMMRNEEAWAAVGRFADQ